MLVQDGSAPMRGVRWRTCPALFKTGMCEMKILGSEVSCLFLMYFCDVGSGWVGTNAWCKMENLSGKVQNGDVWDENLRVWGFVFIFKCIFVMLVQDGLAPIFNIICFTIFTHGAKRDQTVSHSFCWCRIGLKMFDLKKHKMRNLLNLRTRLTILYWLFHALGTFIELRALRALGPGSWGRRKGCFCSASGFLLLAGFYVDMLGPMFSAFGTALS